MTITLERLQNEHREQFIADAQTAFQKAFVEEFGHSEEMILPKNDVEKSLENPLSEAFRIITNGVWVGGVVASINRETNRNSLDFLYINPSTHGKGTGIKVWKAIENRYPETQIWETHTPYFEKRNVHFYVNKCGFHIVEFFNPYHPKPNLPTNSHDAGMDYFFRFEKVMK